MFQVFSLMPLPLPKVDTDITDVIILKENSSYDIREYVGITSNVRLAFFYTKPFVYNSVAICLIMNKLFLHHPV